MFSTHSLVGRIIESTQGLSRQAQFLQALDLLKLQVLVQRRTDGDISPQNNTQARLRHNMSRHNPM